MAYVITQNCCSDASCLAACPVGCIHPRPDEPGFDSAEILHIDPTTCINCGACADACPVEAIKPETDLRDDQRWFTEVNARYYRDHPMSPAWEPRTAATVRAGVGGLRVAIVGSGAAAWYAARSLLRHPGVDVTMLERLPVPGGLIEFGVAPDHPSTKAATTQFRWMRDQQPRFHLHVNVDVGTDIDHADLLRHHHAVIYAHGAHREREIGVAGEPLATGALQFVGWYNNHPAHRHLAPNLRGRRAVIIGNGNVALDMARILCTPPADLSSTSIAAHALAALRDSGIEEVVIVGRRGPEHVAFTAAELHGLIHTPGIDVIVDPADLAQAPSSPTTDLLRAAAAAAPTHAARRIVLRFDTIVTDVSACDTGGLSITLKRRDGGESKTVDASLLLRAIGFRGSPIAGVPFSTDTHTIPHSFGRVIDPASGAVVVGVYTTGWAARGPHGGIGINRTCAETAVEHLLDDYAASGVHSTPAAGFSDLLRVKCSRARTIETAAGYADARLRASTAAGSASENHRLTLSGVRRTLLPLWAAAGSRPSHRSTAAAEGARP